MSDLLRILAFVMAAGLSANASKASCIEDAIAWLGPNFLSKLHDGSAFAKWMCEGDQLPGADKIRDLEAHYAASRQSVEGSLHASGRVIAFGNDLTNDLAMLNAQMRSAATGLESCRADDLRSSLECRAAVVRYRKAMGAKQPIPDPPFEKPYAPPSTYFEADYAAYKDFLNSFKLRSLP